MIKPGKKRKTIKKILIPLTTFLSVVLLLVILEFSNVINFIKSPTKTSPTELSTVEETNTVDYGPPKLEDTITSPEKNNTPKPSSPTTDPTDAISVLITRASRSSVGVFIEKINSGKCILTVNQSGVEKVAIESLVVQERDYSICQGFDLDSSKFDSSPIYIKVTVSSNGRTGMAAQEVN